jgi:transcriptional regulator with GAF, ATPase, and Fis domain
MSKKNKTLENSSSSAIKKDKILITTLSSTDIDFLVNPHTKYSTSPIHTILKEYKNVISNVQLIFNSEDPKETLRGYITKEMVEKYATELCKKPEITNLNFFYHEVKIDDIQKYKTVYKKFTAVFEEIQKDYSNPSFSDYETSPFIVNLSSGSQVYHSVLFFLAKSMLLAETIITNSDGTVKKEGDIGFVPQEILHKKLRQGVAQSVNEKEATKFLETIQKIDKQLIVDKSPQMTRVYQTCEWLAKRDLTILLLGESGAGKDHIANVIHELRVKNGKITGKFKAINVSSFPEATFESEFFGHAKGAFTSAVNDKEGIIKEAEGGTLFLDEIGDLAQPAQAKVLRFLQNGSYYRLGDPKEYFIKKCCVIAATNSPIWKGKEVNFRPDLYHRIAQFKLTIPAIRHRDSISIIIEQIWKNAFNEMSIEDQSLAEIQPEIQKLMLSYDFPGNFRELKQVCINILSMIDIDQITDKKKG